MAVEERHVGPIIAFPREKERLNERATLNRKMRELIVGEIHRSYPTQSHPPQSHISSLHPFTYPKSMVPEIVPPHYLEYQRGFTFIQNTLDGFNPSVSAMDYIPEEQKNTGYVDRYNSEYRKLLGNCI